MARAGVAIEAHGLSHALLTALPPERVAQELRGCRAQLEERGYGRDRLLAYPSGAYAPATLRLAAEAGYRAAFTTESGLVHAGLDRLAWPRVAVHEDVSASRAELLERFPLG
jgi:peptidoglycan/xylan/chitin deacetylase (PgdA/CDA1 family)